MISAVLCIHLVITGTTRAAFLRTLGFLHTYRASALVVTHVFPPHSIVPCFLDTQLITFQ